MDTKNFDPYILDKTTKSITIGQDRISLTKKEFDLAAYLFHHNGVVLSRQTILEHVWGITAKLDTRTIDAHISRLRQKLKLSSTPWQIKSIYRSGYCLYNASLGIKPNMKLTSDTASTGYIHKPGHQFLAALAQHDNLLPSAHKNFAGTKH